MRIRSFVFFFFYKLAILTDLHLGKSAVLYSLHFLRNISIIIVIIIIIRTSRSYDCSIFIIILFIALILQMHSIVFL